MFGVNLVKKRTRGLDVRHIQALSKPHFLGFKRDSKQMFPTKKSKWSFGTITLPYVVRVYGCLLNVVWCVDRMWRGCLALLAVLTATLCCQISEFRCRNGRCVRLDQYCNTVDDCGDMSDEPRYCTGTLQVEVVVARVV